MPFIVVDTSVSLPATWSPSGLTRKFFVLLAYGAVSYEVEHGQLEVDALVKQAEGAGGEVRGLERAKDRRALAADRRAALEELLPHGTPYDWVAIGSAPLFDEYERKLREIGKRIAPALRDVDVPKLRRQVEAICAAGSPPFDPRDAPALTRDPKDDPIVYTALLGDATCWSPTTETSCRMGSSITTSDSALGAERGTEWNFASYGTRPEAKQGARIFCAPGRATGARLATALGQESIPVRNRSRWTERASFR